jgi:hypothetical protein
MLFTDESERIESLTIVDLGLAIISSSTEKDYIDFPT